MMERNFALIGYPLGHTMSPVIHKRLFELSEDFSSRYSVVEIKPEHFRTKAPELFELSGFNVTIPHKLNIIKYLDQLDLSAKRYGAVNVVKCGEQNIGYNTDVDGFLRSIESLGTDLSGRVLLLGCGGAGRMMAIETIRRGGELTIAVRNRPESIEKGQNVLANIHMLAEDAKVSLTTLESVSGQYDILLNSTPCGMYPHSEEMPVSKQVVEGIPYLFDAVYNPRATELVQTARANGAAATGGMAMLVWQAAVAHEIWDGVTYDPEIIHSLVNEMEDYVEHDFGK